MCFDLVKITVSLYYFDHTRVKYINLYCTQKTFVHILLKEEIYDYGTIALSKT